MDVILSQSVLAAPAALEDFREEERNGGKLYLHATEKFLQ